MRVLLDTWEESESTFQGARMTMAYGNIVSTEDPTTETRNATCQVYFLTIEEELAFRAAVPRGFAVGVSGDLAEIPFAAYVDITQVSRQQRTIPAYGTILVRVATLHIVQALPSA